MKMIHWLAQVFEDANGLPDEARIMACLIVLSFIGNEAMSVYMSATHTFDPQQFGIGAGALSAGIGSWFKLRAAN